MDAAALTSAETKRIILERLNAEITSKKTVAIRHRRRRRRRRLLRHDDSATKDKKNMSGRKRKRVVESVESSINGEVDSTMGTAKQKTLINNVKSVVIKSRFVVGINECTRTLEGIYKIIVRQEHEHHMKCIPQSTEEVTKSTTANIVPSLILLARDVRPTDVVCHFYMYAKLLNIPILVLPGMRASEELGKAAGIRSAAVALFLPMPSLTDNGIIASDVDNNEDRREEKREWRKTHADVDSFVRYAITKIPR